MADSSPNKVYLLLVITDIPYFIEGDTEVVGVFSSQEKAEEVERVRKVDLLDDPWYQEGQIFTVIHEMEIDSAYPGLDTVGDSPDRAAEEPEE